ncbi:MAG: sarcosine oxidase subunit delta family protein [Alphaproteobacteria bacterium]|nr:sarcosine oxidase subunit delta family protein [Alphaproteobacteria bacterium]
MLLIDCPWCGPRDQREFNYGGDGTVVRPPDPSAATDEAWHDYIYIRDNPRGSHVELWQHNAGCRRWFKVRRDVVTHEMQGSAPIGRELPPKP